MAGQCCNAADGPENVHQQCSDHSENDCFTHGSQIPVEITAEQGNDIVKVAGRHDQRDGEGSVFPMGFFQTRKLHSRKTQEYKSAESTYKHSHQQRVVFADDGKIKKCEKRKQRRQTQGNERLTVAESCQIGNDLGTSGNIGDKESVKNDPVGDDCCPFSPSAEIGSVKGGQVKKSLLPFNGFTAQDFG